MKSGPLLYLNWIHVILGAVGMIMIFAERHRYSSVSWGIKAVLLGVGLLVLGGAWGMADVRSFNWITARDIYSLHKTDFAIARIVGFAYVVLVWGIEALLIALVQKARLHANQGTRSLPNKAL